MIVRRTTSRATARDVPIACDAEIVRRLASGELSALGELYDRYHEPLRRFIARATSDAEDVDDLVHATFLAAAKLAARFDGRASCRPWLTGIAAQLLRRRGRALSRFFAVMTSFQRSRAAHVDPRAAREARGDVERALAQLSETKRITFLMATLEGLSCEEIAAALQIPIGTVWTRLHAARRELRLALAEDGEP
jgi:RNA polymerase sigma-70 factor (ECF subfamily)